MKLLDAVLRRGQPLDAALGVATSDIERADDRALAQAIASEALRRLPDLDALIDSATRQPLPHDAKPRMVLRIALVQALVLGTPPHAAIATALPLVEGGPRRLVHGVFGTLMRGQAQLRAIPMLPDAVERRWGAAWGEAMLADARAMIAVPPPLDLTLRDVAGTEPWAVRLGGTSLAPGHVRVDRGTAIAELPGFAEGAWWVQNIAASLPARLLGPGHGRRALDLCAAPGGKTLQLAANGWAVTALDQSEARLERLSANLERTRLAAEIIAADVMTWEPSHGYDAILLDAPCSATGIFARHPDVLHRVRPKDIAALAALQAAMLARASGWLAPGGRLVYATCSLEPAEGEDIARASGLAVDPIAAAELPEGFVPTAEGFVRVLPRDHRDGFFIARFQPLAGGDSRH